jgi:hypothetical protein
MDLHYNHDFDDDNVNYFVVNIIIIPCYTFRNYALGDYAVLYEMLSFCDWSWVCKQSSVESSLSALNPIVTESLNQANAYMCSGKSTFPCWFQVF